MTRYLNQTGLLPQENIDEYAIGIIGLGAIGSFAMMALTKMGFKNVVGWDFDKYEEHNVATQMCPVDMVGKHKAIVARTMAKQFSGEDVITIATKASGKKAFDYVRAAFPHKLVIMILAVDSLDVRREIVESMRQAYGCYVIDPRMGAKTYRVMGFHPDEAAELTAYLATLVPDAEAVQERCGQKSIIYTVLGVAAEVCSFVHQYVMEPNITRSPMPVVFDYGTGMRIQQIRRGEVVDLTGDNVAEQPVAVGAEDNTAEDDGMPF